MQSDLVHALQAIARDHHGDSTTISIRCDGQGERAVRFGYVVQAPVWKTTYRLVLDEAHVTTAKLQGWAVIENETDDDWVEVPVSLVSGRPISFIEELSRPRYLPRVEVSTRQDQDILPTLHRGAQLQLLANQQVEMNDLSEQRSGGARKPAAADQLQAPLNLTRSIQVAAQASTLDARTVFSVASVTVPRQRSAMIPILNEDITAEAVSIYGAQNLGICHPLSGVIITNTTSKDLLQGPVTVLGGEGYRGDAMLDNLPPGDHRLMSFAVDLSVQAQTSGATLISQVVQAGIASGVLHLSVRDLRTVTYRFANSSDGARLLVVEHPRHERWSLVDSPQPWEQSPASYRWKLPLPAGGTRELLVQEQSQRLEALSISDLDDTRLLALSRDGKLPPAISEALVQVLQKRRSLAQVEAVRLQTVATITALATDQERLRRTLSVLQQPSALYQRLMDRLTVQETALEGRQQVLADCQQQSQDLMRQLDGLINAGQPR